MTQRMIRRIVCTEEGGMSLGEYLRTCMNLSKNQVTRLKKHPQGILVDDHHQTVRYLLRAGEMVAVAIDWREENRAIIPQEMPLNIIAEDDALLIIDKPAGLVMYPSYAGHLDNLASGVLAHWRHQGNEGIFRPLMRLDKDTSGVVAIAKNAYVQARLAQSHMEKIYLAWVGGHMMSKGSITLPIGKGDDRRRVVCAEGRYARTDYEILWESSDKTLVKVWLHTGRTHQIRVHFAHIGHPLLGDALYGGDCTFWQRQALHAYQLSLAHPLSGQQCIWQSPLVEDFVNNRMKIEK